MTARIGHKVRALRFQAGEGLGNLRELAELGLGRSAPQGEREEAGCEDDARSHDFSSLPLGACP